MKWDEPEDHNRQTSQELKYRHDRAHTPRHTKDELNAAALAAQSGGAREAATLQAMMRPYVVALNRYFDRQGMGYSRHESDELKQIIWEGVWVALERFDPEAGTKFSSYAYFWMRHAAQEWMSKNSRILPLPRTSWALGLRLEEAFYLAYPDGDITEATDAMLAALVIVNPKNISQTRTVPHAGAILRAKRNGTEFDPENEMEQVKPTGTTEEDYFEEVHDTDMDAIDTMNAMTELASSRDPRAEEEGLALAYKFVDKHDLPDEVAERMMEEAGL